MPAWLSVDAFGGNLIHGATIYSDTTNQSFWCSGMSSKVYACLMSASRSSLEIAASDLITVASKSRTTISPVFL